MSLSDYDKLSHDAGACLTRTSQISAIRKRGNYGIDPVLWGFKYEQLNLVIDGAQRALATCPNRMDPPACQISLNQMDRVEILKGPYFLRYGPALGGTINFITPDPRFRETVEPTGRLSSSYESNGNIFRTEGSIGFSHHAVMLNFNGSWSGGNDYHDGLGMAIPSSFSRGSFGSSLAFRMPGKQNLSANITRNFARDVIFAALPMDLRKDILIISRWDWIHTSLLGILKLSRRSIIRRILVLFMNNREPIFNSTFFQPFYRIISLLRSVST